MKNIFNLFSLVFFSCLFVSSLSGNSLYSNRVSVLNKDLKNMNWRDLKQKKADLQSSIINELLTPGILGFKALSYMDKLDELTKKNLEFNEITLTKLRGICYVKIGDYEKARIFLTKSLAIEPDFNTSYLLAFIHFIYGNFDLALRILKDMPESYGFALDDKQIYNMLLFLCYKETENEKKALKILKNEEEGSVFWYYGNILLLLEKGELRKAGELVKEANYNYPRLVLTIEKILQYYFMHNKDLSENQQSYIYIVIP